MEKLIEHFKIKGCQRSEFYPHKLEIYMENYKISQKTSEKREFFTEKFTGCEKLKKTKMWKTFREENSVSPL